MNTKKIGNIVYLGLFGILYCSSAFVSTMHAIEFFSLANVGYLAIMLALTYEIGQAAVLSSLLIDKRNQKKVVPWILMGVLTICQILGNTFSVYKNICLNSMNELVWIKEPIFVFANDFPDKQATIIITWVMGALLPVISLLMCEMVTSYIHSDKEDKVPELTKQEKIKEDKKEEPEHKIENEQVQEQTNQEEEAIKEDGRICERDNSGSKEPEGVVNETDEGDTENLTKEEAEPEVSEPEISKPNLKSQFLNI
nr:MAG TPA: hypothetical protein [Ackermannviridae sp.]